MSDDSVNEEKDRKNTPERRTIILVNKNLQMKVGLKLVIITGVLISILSFLIIWAVISTGTPTFLDIESERQYFIQIKIMIGSVIFLVLCGCGAVYGFAIWLMHKIAGPLVPIDRCLDAILEGRYDAPDIKLRKGDEFKDMADKLNRIKNKLRTQ